MTEGPRFAADTNIYVEAANDRAFAQAFASFLGTHGPVELSSVVVAEILFAYPDAKRRRAVVTRLERHARAITPHRSDWLRAARAVARLGGERVTKTRSFWNDALLAAQCARLDLTLITANTADFARLSRFIPVRVAAPFPS